LPAGVAVDVTLGGLDGSVASEQLNVAQAAAAAVDVARGGRDEGSSAGVRRASLEAKLFEHSAAKPVDHAGRGAKQPPRAERNDWPGWFRLFRKQASKRHGAGQDAWGCADRHASWAIASWIARLVGDLAARIEDH